MIIILLDMEPDRGMIGVGVLILMIALLVIISIATVSIMATGQGLSMKAYITSGEVEEGVTSGLDIVLLTGSDASENDETPGTIENLEVTVKLRGGSDPVALNRTTLIIEHSNDQHILKFGGVEELTGEADNTTHYIATYMNRGPQAIDSYVVRGDIVRLKMNLSGEGIGSRKKVRLSIMHRMGITNRLMFAMPEAMSRGRHNLYPPTEF